MVRGTFLAIIGATASAAIVIAFMATSLQPSSPNRVTTPNETGIVTSFDANDRISAEFLAYEDLSLYRMAFPFTFIVDPVFCEGEPCIADSWPFYEYNLSLYGEHPKPGVIKKYTFDEFILLVKDYFNEQGIVLHNVKLEKIGEYACDSPEGCREVRKLVFMARGENVPFLQKQGYKTADLDFFDRNVVKVDPSRPPFIHNVTLAERDNVLDLVFAEEKVSAFFAKYYETYKIDMLLQYRTEEGMQRLRDAVEEFGINELPELKKLPTNSPFVIVYIDRAPVYGELTPALRVYVNPMDWQVYAIVGFMGSGVFDIRPVAGILPDAESRGPIFVGDNVPFEDERPIASSRLFYEFNTKQPRVSPLDDIVTWEATRFAMYTNGTFVLDLDLKYLSEDPKISRGYATGSTTEQTYSENVGNYTGSVVFLSVSSNSYLSPIPEETCGNDVFYRSNIVPIFLVAREADRSSAISYHGEYNFRDYCDTEYGVGIIWLRIFETDNGDRYYQWLRADGKSPLRGEHENHVDFDKEYFNIISGNFRSYYPLPSDQIWDFIDGWTRIYLSQDMPALRITEIQYDYSNPVWIEFYNDSDTTIVAKGITLDTPLGGSVPESLPDMELLPGEYKVVQHHRYLVDALDSHGFLILRYSEGESSHIFATDKLRRPSDVSQTWQLDGTRWVLADPTPGKPFGSQA